MNAQKEIRIAAALISRRDGKILLVRKQGSPIFMQPGGKIEVHETPIMALCRELQEELNLDVNPADPVYLGSFSAPAANEPGFIVTAELFQLDVSETMVPSAELEEVLWTDPDRPGDTNIAPLTRDHVFKLCRLMNHTVADKDDADPIELSSPVCYMGEIK